jgi:hypothetical protein
MPLKLPRLPTNQRLVDENGFPTDVMQLWWQKVVEDVEASINGIALALDAAGIALDAADAAQTAADNADAAAAAAQGAADSTTESTALASSYVEGITVTATDAGANATITISAHDRIYIYDPPTPIAVFGGSITGLAYSTLYYVYYDQPSRAGGSVTYQTTINNTDVAQINNRHSVAQVTTPAAAAPPNNGGGVRPPGGTFEQ